MSLVAARRPHCSGFSRGRAWALGTQASVFVVQPVKPSCTGDPARVTWPALAGGFLATDTSEVPEQFLGGVLVLVSPWEFSPGQ